MIKARATWFPAVALGLGALFTVGIDTQRSLELRVPLQEAIPDSLAGYPGRDITLSDAEVRVAGVTDYLMRNYEDPASPDRNWFSVYVGYYAQQTHGRSIHSPKNCLPGGGWEALASRVAVIETEVGEAKVNRYVLQKGDQQALVLYWYQGRGRVQANEYAVKWDLLRDAALRQRSDEALVRIVVPLGGDEGQAFQRASGAAAKIIPALQRALPQ